MSEESPASEEHPIYAKVLHEEPSETPLYFITVNEGWREDILCEGMYGWAADWLIEKLQRTPYVPEEMRKNA